jgi:phospholipid/cholesterol/gamma-HCH transport system substrate-binding protein
MSESRSILEITVGAFLIAGIAALAYLATQLGEIRPFGADVYRLTARFVSSSGLKPGAYVEVGGVRVGYVDSITLDPGTYQSVVSVALRSGVRLQEDAIASIRTSGIIGDKFVKISPGGSDVLLEPGGEIRDTESAISLEELISKYIFESK